MMQQQNGLKMNLFEKNTQFIELKDKLIKDITAIKNRKLKVSAKKLDQLRKKEQSLIVNANSTSNKADIIEAASARILESYNPGPANATAKDLIALAPLTKSWFDSNAWLKKHFNEYWESLGIGWGDKSGEVWPIEDDIKDALSVLKSNVDKLPKGKEQKWVRNLDLAKKEVIVFIASGTFKFDGDTLYAEGVAVKQQFGNIIIAPFQTVMIHEMNMTGKMPIGGDTHIHKDHSSDIYEKADKIDLNKLQLEDPDKIDDLYQSDSYLELINISILLGELKKIE